MSSVCVLTPIVVGSWPMIAAAVASAASTMGFTINVPVEAGLSGPKLRQKAVVDIENSAAAEAGMALQQTITMYQGDLEIQVKQDQRGALSVCVIGESHSKSELEAIGKQVSGRIVQQFAYHKLMSELRTRGFDIVDQSVSQDQSIQVRVRMNS